MRNKIRFRQNLKLKTQNSPLASASHIRHYLLLAAVLLGLVGSFFLPNAVAAYMDARRLDNLVVIGAQSMVFNADTELNLPRRIALIASSDTEMLVLATGQTMEREAAEARAIEELSKFFGDSSFEFIFDEYTVEEGSSGLAINSRDPSESMITWEFRILDSLDNEATVTIDDETGIILKILYRRGKRKLNTEGAAMWNSPDISDEEMYNTALMLTGMMTSYYGFPVGLGDYEFRGNIAYYMAYMMAYMSGVSNGVPLYGVVRATGFTMNERL